MLKILYCNRDTVIRNLAESLVISGFPMETRQHTTETLTKEIGDLYEALSTHDKVLHSDLAKGLTEEQAKLIVDYCRRGRNLGASKLGEGHNCYLKGVQFNVIINAPLSWLKQYQRYHFTDIISSCSTMHKILEMDLKEACEDTVDFRILNILNEYIEAYNNTTDMQSKERIFEQIVANCPSGLTLTQGITLNYLQAVSMYKQRKGHKLGSWKKDFIPFIEELPLFMELTQKNK